MVRPATFTYTMDATLPQFTRASQPAIHHHRTHPGRLPPLLPASADEHPVTASQPSPSQDGVRRKPRSRSHVVSPFRDSVGMFGKFNPSLFQRPHSGQLNGYIKVNWPRVSASVESCNPYATVEDLGDITVEDSSPSTELISVPYGIDPATMGPARPPSTAGSASPLPVHSPRSDWSAMPGSSRSSPAFSQDSKMLVPATKPRLVPPHFGSGAKMNSTDRRFWEFCESA